MKPRKVIERKSIDVYDLEGPIPEIVERLQKILEEKPSAKIDLINMGDYDSIEALIVYERDETEQELQARLKRAAQARQRQKDARIQKEALEKEIYEKLKKRYG